ncbi:hypothetical protein BZZ01_10680 [Nostocales cyanobacterium HT-58-2]|nr:hypothetical protein BZZ01_10680 [Nostocales cyanobacterium HT-58-2]
MEKAILEQADCVISTSPQEAEDLRQLISQYGRIEVIPCGIDTEHFGSISKKEQKYKGLLTPHSSTHHTKTAVEDPAARIVVEAKRRTAVSRIEVPRTPAQYAIIITIII